MKGSKGGEEEQSWIRMVIEVGKDPTFSHVSAERTTFPLRPYSLPCDYFVAVKFRFVLYPSAFPFPSNRKPNTHHESSAHNQHSIQFCHPPQSITTIHSTHPTHPQNPKLPALTPKILPNLTLSPFPLPTPRK